MDENLLLVLTKGGVNLAVALIGLGAGWLVGRRLTYQWNVRQKCRELDLLAAQDFQQLYGEFFSIWKLWNGMARGRGANDPALSKELLQRAADAEGLVERLLVKLATERRLAAADRHVLGAFRQGYQQLRNAIEMGEPLRWTSSEHPEYLTFKRLAVAVVAILQRDAPPAMVSAHSAFEALRDITSNRHESSWATETTA